MLVNKILNYIKTKNLIESISLMFFITVIKLAFLGVGAYLLLKEYIGCGITCLIFAFISGFSYHYSDKNNKEDENESK